MQNKDPLKKRYIYKLSTNALGMLVGFFTQAIIPRGLGPKAYGDFTFINNFFTFLVAFFDAGTSTCFYTKLSQRPEEYKLMWFYGYFMGFVTLITALFVTTANMFGAGSSLWPGQAIQYVYMGAFFAVVAWVCNIANQMADAFGLTVSAELGKMFQKVIGLAIIVSLFFIRKLDLFNFFIYNYVITLLFIAILAAIMRKQISAMFASGRIMFSQTRRYVSEFYKYTHPLFVSSLVVTALSMFEIWLLQASGGSVQQGFYGLSNQISTICFLFTGAMTPLIMREFSIAHSDNDPKRMYDLFRKNVPLLFSVTAFVACFIAVNAKEVTIIVGGGKFSAAWLAVAIMALYPIHRVYGQLSGSLFLATGQTGLYRNISIAFAFVGLPVTYFLLAPKDMFGLNMGAEGLAIKTVLLCFITVNVQLFFNAKFLKFSFLKYFIHQLVSAGSLLFIALSAGAVIQLLFGRGGNVLFNFLFSGALYTAVVCVLVYIYPRLFGLTQDDIKKITNYFKLAA